jgi:hypothetical protein
MQPPLSLWQRLGCGSPCDFSHSHSPLKQGKVSVALLKFGGLWGLCDRAKWSIGLLFGGRTRQNGRGVKCFCVPQAGTAVCYRASSGECEPELAVEMWPLSSPCLPCYPMLAFSARGLAQQSLLVLLLGSDVPLLGELGGRTEQSPW